MKSVITILAIIIVLIAGFLIFNRDEGELARDNNNVTNEEMLGTGGADEGFDPLEDLDGDGIKDSEDDMVEDKG